MYNTKTFTDIYGELSDFQADKNTYITTVGTNGVVTDATINLTYQLLYAKYGNSPIANLDENQFKAKIFTTIWQYGPTWEKKLAIQKDIRALSSTDILVGSKAIHNHALNPENLPSAEELNYINEQDTTKYTKSKMDAYGQLYDLLVQDVTDVYLLKFKPLFQQVVNSRAYLYESED
jgi:hypothetical protein